MSRLLRFICPLAICLCVALPAQAGGKAPADPEGVEEGFVSHLAQAESQRTFYLQPADSQPQRLWVLLLGIASLVLLPVALEKFGPHLTARPPASKV
jgi:hypothetical protein